MLQLMTRPKPDPEEKAGQEHFKHISEPLKSIVDRMEHEINNRDYAALVMEDGDWVKP